MKRIEGSPDFLLFFDDVLMNDFVLSFSTGASDEGLIGRASISLMYLPSLDRIKVSSGTSVYFKDSIDDMTNCKLFIKNVFSGKYDLVFDGNIRGKSVNETPGSESLNYAAVDHMQSLSRAAAPIAIPIDEKIRKSIEFKLNSQGLDISGISPVTDQGSVNWKGKGLADVVNDIKENSLTRNAIFSDTEGVSYWNGSKDRILIMGDIDKDLVARSVLDYQATVNAFDVESLYVTINDFSQKMMFEFFQDIDGYIKIKPPFWNEPILKSHIIDSTIVTSRARNSSWEGRYTRIASQGAPSEVMAANADNLTNDFFTPIGTLIGHVGEPGGWAEMRYNVANTEGVVSTSSLPYTSVATSTAYVSALESGISLASIPCISKTITSYFGPRNGAFHSGIDIAPTVRGSLNDNAFAAAYGTIMHAGPQSNGISHGYGNHIIIQHAGFMTVYAHLDQVFVSKGEIVEAGKIIGKVGNTGNSTGAHLHFEIRISTYSSATFYQKDAAGKMTGVINPINYFLAVQKLPPVATSDLNSSFDVVSINSSKLIAPSAIEKKYGLNIFNADQPLIKATVEGGSADDAVYDTLKSYSQFMYNMLNSLTNTAQIDVIPAPWLRPGMNCWLEPSRTDIVYYISSVSHSFSTQDGMNTSLVLCHGRDGKDFFSGRPSVFGSVTSSSAVQVDNIFVNEVVIGSDNYGPVVKDTTGYNNYMKTISAFHESDNGDIIKAESSKFHSDLYSNQGKPDLSANLAVNTVSQGTMAYWLPEFSYERSRADIIAIISNMYTHAPSIVKARSKTLKSAIASAIKEIPKYYYSE